MEWLVDPNIWIGLSTLIVLEIVLGIDNLVFIAILADKLPAHQRDRARMLGLSLALGMRIALLFSIAWIITLTQPFFTVAGLSFSGRDLILIFGGVFLLAKGTLELHERLEGAHKPRNGKVVHAVFWQVIAQIVVLDAVFSLDSVITAVGMVEELPVMVAAVCVAMAVMMMASTPLMGFVGKHPTVVILCLGFLLMIGFSLVVEGFGYHIPKGYLYAAIGFSILIEAANQAARRNREKRITTHDLRARTSDAVLRLLGGRRGDAALSETIDVLVERTTVADVFHPQEKEMIQGVLDLGARPVRSIMTPRTEVEWLDLDQDAGALREAVRGLTHSRVLLARGRIDDFVGVALTRDLLAPLLDGAPIEWASAVRQPVILHEGSDVLRLIDHLRSSAVQLAVILDEHGAFEGIATPTDILEAIAGEFPDIGDRAAEIVSLEDGVWEVDGFMDVRRLGKALGRDLTDRADRYSTLAGLIATHMGRYPDLGAVLTTHGLSFEVTALDGRSIERVVVRSA